LNTASNLDTGTCRLAVISKLGFLECFIGWFGFMNISVMATALQV